MKTMLKVTLVIAFAAFANTLFATGNLKMNVIPVSGEKAIVAISSVSDSNFQISMTDEKGQIGYYKETSDSVENYRKMFDLSQLDPGVYKITVKCNNLTTQREFRKTYYDIKVGEEKTVLEPFFSYKNGLLRCTYLNFSKENLTLYFFENNELLYTKNIGRNFNVNEALNLSKLKDGTYQAILSTGDNDYLYTVEK